LNTKKDDQFFIQTLGFEVLGRAFLCVF